MTIELLDELDYSGSLGCVVLFDESPRLTPARVRPFIASVLLLRGAVREGEVIDSLSPHAHPDDLRSWDSEATQLELVVIHALHGLVKKNILRVREDGLYVLANTSEGTRFAITAVSALDAQMPDHLLQEVGQNHYHPTRNV